MAETSGWQVRDEAPRFYHDQAWRFMELFAKAVVDSAVAEGDAVLDVACGTGIATRMAKEVAGPTGPVVGSDINRPMLDFAEELSAQRGDGIEWREASALELPFRDGQFDSVICQQGVQFFPDPSRGLAEMARVVGSGGTISISVWGEIDGSPYFDAMAAMLTEFCGAQETDVAWFTGADEVSQWFTSCGLEARIDLKVAEVTLPPLTEFVPVHMKATPFAKAFDDLPVAEVTQAIASMQRQLGLSAADEQFTVPFSSYIATART